MDIPEERKIITHMNREHTRQLSHFLRHYAGLSAAAASPASLRDVTMQGMLIRANGADYRVPFEPPLTSWSVLPPRIDAMDAAAREALGISDIYITSYAPPRIPNCMVMGAVLFYFACAASLPWVVPGSALWGAVAAVFPGGPERFKWIVKVLLLPVLGVHTMEVVLLDRRRMQRHGVARWSSVWWLWEANVFVEGLTAWWRIDNIIAEKKLKEAKKL